MFVRLDQPFEDGMTSERRSAGYHFLTTKPEVGSPSEMKRVFSFAVEDPHRYITIHKDRARLLGQRIIVPFASLGLLLVFHDPKRRLRLIFGGISLCIAFGFLALYVFLFRPLL